MKRLMVRYKVKADQVAANEDLIREVFGELNRERPEGVRYAAFKLPDGQSFVHVVSIEASDDTNPLAALPAFKAFTADIRDRCEEPPAAFDLTEVGSYNFLR
ncbi:MAG: hypothetical protein JSW68_02735 [Burkholderiales bacterium]|nr:MAG: hypothetical protein JSW68_02735 [Burkholderiales bacterium]